MGVFVVSSSFSVVFEDEQVDSPISSSLSPEFEDERITGRGSEGEEGCWWGRYGRKWKSLVAKRW